MVFSCGSAPVVIRRFSVLIVVDLAFREGAQHRTVKTIRRMTRGAAGGRKAIFMPVFYCALATRESRIETICHPVGKAG